MSTARFPSVYAVQVTHTSAVAIGATVTGGQAPYSVVLLPDAARCSCSGNLWRGQCRHIGLVAAHLQAAFVALLDATIAAETGSQDWAAVDAAGLTASLADAWVCWAQRRSERVAKLAA